MNHLVILLLAITVTLGTAQYGRPKLEDYLRNVEEEMEKESERYVMLKLQNQGYKLPPPTTGALQKLRQLKNRVGLLNIRTTRGGNTGVSLRHYGGVGGKNYGGNGWDSYGNSGWGSYGSNVIANHGATGWVNVGNIGFPNHGSSGPVSYSGTGWVNQGANRLISHGANGWINQGNHGPVNYGGKGSANHGTLGWVNQGAHGLTQNPSHGYTQNVGHGWVNQGSNGWVQNGDHGRVNHGSDSYCGHPSGYGWQQSASWHASTNDGWNHKATAPIILTSNNAGSNPREYTGKNGWTSGQSWSENLNVYQAPSGNNNVVHHGNGNTPQATGWTNNVHAPSHTHVSQGWGWSSQSNQPYHGSSSNGWGRNTNGSGHIRFIPQGWTNGCVCHTNGVYGWSPSPTEIKIHERIPSLQTHPHGIPRRP